MIAGISTQEMVDKFWECVPHVWRQTRIQIRQIAEEKHQVSEGQFQVLRRIRRGNTSVSSLAKVSGTRLSSVSKLVDTLVKRGLVARLQDPHDRRRIPLVLTPDGQKVMQEIFMEAEEWLSVRFKKLNSDQRSAFIRGLEALNSTFEEASDRR